MADLFGDEDGLPTEILPTIKKPPEVWRYYSYRVFCGSDPLKRGIVQWYVANDNPDMKPIWIANYHYDIPGSREIAWKSIEAAMNRIAWFGRI